MQRKMKSILILKVSVLLSIGSTVRLPLPYKPAQRVFQAG